MAEHQINWLEKQYNALHKLLDIAYELADYSQSFHIIGNIAMANNLVGISNKILKIEKEIKNAIGQDLNEQVKRSNESSNTMLLATLTGIEIAQTKKRK